jgi:hypothetical protein
VPFDVLQENEDYMNTKLLVGFGRAFSVACILIISATQSEVAPKPVILEDPIGTWTTHHRQSFLSILLHRDKTAHIIWVMKGSHQIMDAKWDEAPGGVVIDSGIRFRFWWDQQIRGGRAKVKMEELPLDMLGGEWQVFPSSFYMTLAVHRGFENPDLKKFAERPFPNGWDADEPPQNFDQQAGKPRVPEKPKP